jgi:hypothetical protein
VRAALRRRDSGAYVFEPHANENAGADGQSCERGCRRIKGYASAMRRRRSRHLRMVCDQKPDSCIKVRTGRALGKVARVLLQQLR